MHNGAEICGKGKAFLRIHQENGVEKYRFAKRPYLFDT
jgi:hypothetical protein